MDVSEVKPEMRGIGLTVFSGTKIDTFSVEIIGVLKKVVPKGDIIIARLSGGKIDNAGLIAGMSGSPVYIHDKLIGAVAYQLGVFSKEPICGITPIKEMSDNESYGLIDGSGLSPIPTPCAVSGIIPTVFPTLSDIIRTFGMMPLQGGGGSVDKAIIPSPGSVLGAVLVDGDANISAIGTCTERDGNKILGFGHPLLGLGKVSIPMTGGYVLSVAPSIYASFKISSTSKIIGTIEGDGTSGVQGTIGKLPPMTELTVQIKGEKYFYRIVKDETLLPRFVNILIQNSIFKEVKREGNITLSSNTQIEAKNKEPLIYNDIWTGNIHDVMTPLSKSVIDIVKNGIEKLDIGKIKIKVNMQEEVRSLYIEGAYVSRKEIHPGDTLDVVILLRPYRGAPKKILTKVVIPEFVSSRKLILSIEEPSDRRRELERRVKKFNDIVRYLKERPKESELVIRLLETSNSHSLPPSIASLTKEERKTIFEKRIETGWVVRGKKKINLEVK
jgi:hypothetical protein